MKLLLNFVAIISISKAYPPVGNTLEDEVGIDSHPQLQGASRGQVDPAAAAALRLANKNARTINIQSENTGDEYHYIYETDNGITAHETGIADEGTQAHGAYSYTGDEGQKYAVYYTADKDGFRVLGNHLPTPQPLPAEIVKSLEQNAADEANGIHDDGSYRHHEHVEDPNESHVTQYSHENYVPQNAQESHVTQYPHESDVDQHPYGRRVTQHPYKSHVTKNSLNSQVTQYPHETYVTQHKYGNHVTQHPHENHVTQHPHISHVTQQYETFKADINRVHGAHHGAKNGYHKY